MSDYGQMIDAGVLTSGVPRRARAALAVSATMVALAACSSSPAPPAASPARPAGDSVPSATVESTPSETAESVARAYLAAWSAGRTSAAAALTSKPVAARTALQGMRKDLDVAKLQASAAEVVADGDDRSTVAYQADVTVDELGTWSYQGALPLTRTDGRWKVKWSPAVLHPQMSEGAELELRRAKPAPARVLDRNGAVLPSSGSRADAAVRVIAGTPKGSPGATIGIKRGGGSTTTLHTFAPTAQPGPVRTTLDSATQQAAQRALATISGKAASIVAIDSRTGEIRAVASRDASGASTRNRAFLNSAPPGSTFKTITAYAALRNGTTLNTVVSCPEKIDVGGRMVGNFRGFKLGDVPFRKDFAESCNTAMIYEAMRMPHGLMTSSAKALGFAREHNTGIPSFDGSLRETGSKVDRAYASLGQGSVQANPLTMATVAATVASGTYRSPVLLQSAAKSAGEPLPAKYAADLKTLLREAARGGSAWKHLSSAGGDIGAKTGTAEFASSAKPGTHAWLIGFRGNLAFAVQVENGGVGGPVAGPVAGAFLRGLR